MIARPFAGPAPTVDPGGNEAARTGGAQQQMVDAQARVAREGVPEILPEGVDPLIRVQSPQRDRPDGAISQPIRP